MRLADGARAFSTPKNWGAAAMLQEDLVAAKVLKRDEDGKFIATGEQGRVVDFHALRHTFISNLANGGVAPKVAQALARHSTITLTLDRYTHLRADDEVNALLSLPDLDAPEPEGQPIKTELRPTESDKVDGEMRSLHSGRFSAPSPSAPVGAGLPQARSRAQGGR